VMQIACQSSCFGVSVAIVLIKQVVLLCVICYAFSQCLSYVRDAWYFMCRIDIWLYVSYVSAPSVCDALSRIDRNGVCCRAYFMV
jgi:hypothetical protein